MRLPLILTIAAVAIAAPALAQEASPLSPAERAKTLDVLTRRLDHYVFPERKPVILAGLAAERTRLLALEDAEAFRAAVNAVLLETSHDRHLSIWIERGAEGPPPTEAQMLAMEDRDGFGVAAARRLPGDVAYLKLSRFSGHPAAGAAIDRAMADLAGANGLILDLRENGGGGEAALNRLLGHLASRPMPMMTVRMRRCAPDPVPADACVQDGARDEALRQADAVDHPAFATQPIWVLTSAGTFSAAEEAAYDLQAVGRATLVGERTKGGANPSFGMDAGPRFSVVLPVGVTAHPMTGANWDADGVAPDVPVEAGRALVEAYARALTATRQFDLASRAEAILKGDVGL